MDTEAKMRFGFNEDYTAHLNFLHKAKELRADIARQGIRYDLYEPWIVNNWCRAMREKGVKPLITLYSSASDYVSIDRYVSVARDIYNHNNDVLLQILNEPNNPHYSLPSAHVIDLVKAVKQALPSEAKLLGPPMSPGVNTWQGDLGEIHDSVDIPVSLHIYPVRDALQETKDDFKFGKTLHKDVWVTEIGMQRRYFSNQADASVRAYKWLNGHNAKSCIFHRLAEPQQPNEWEVNARLWFLWKDGAETGLFKKFEQVRA
jgi:hypothetical protein